jgi:hypothetical protein
MGRVWVIFHDATHKSDLAAVYNMVCYWSIFWGRIQTKHKIPLILVLDQNGSFS